MSGSPRHRPRLRSAAAVLTSMGAALAALDGAPGVLHEHVVGDGTTTILTA